MRGLLQRAKIVSQINIDKVEHAVIFLLVKTLNNSQNDLLEAQVSE